MKLQKGLSIHREASETLKNWAADVTDFLELLVVNRFRGFGHLAQISSDYRPELPSFGKVFWEGLAGLENGLSLSQR